MNISHRLRTCARHTGLDAVIELLNEAADEIERLSATQPADVTDEPGLSSGIVNDACWKFVEAMPHQLPGPIWNDLKPALYASLIHYHRAIFALRPVQVPVSVAAPHIAMGFGRYEVGSGTYQGTPCIAFGKNGTGKVGDFVHMEPRQMSAEETVAVITFANVEGLDVLQEKVDEVRALHFSDTHPAPGVPEFSRIAKRKLTELQEQGFAVTGYAIQRGHVRGFIDGGGFVGWWQGEPDPGLPDDVARDAKRWRVSELISEAALKHPDSRTEAENTAFNAYRVALSSGNSYASCIDAAMLAASPAQKGGE